jgi:hypothetical protein
MPKLAPNLRHSLPWKMKGIAFMVFFLALLQGCLMTQDIEEESEEVLYPPQILLDTLEPPDSGKLKLDANCNYPLRQVTFSIGLVRDLNKRDTFYVRWFVDWDPNRTQPVWEYRIEPPTGQSDRPISPYVLALQPLDDGDWHTLKLFVADRPPLQGGNGTQFPDGSEGQWDTYQWTFTVATEGYCDQP